jgi:hypothetical protein
VGKYTCASPHLHSARDMAKLVGTVPSVLPDPRARRGRKWKLHAWDCRRPTPLGQNLSSVRIYWVPSKC